jgi:hypothetical protein
MTNNLKDTKYFILLPPVVEVIVGDCASIYLASSFLEKYNKIKIFFSFIVFFISSKPPPPHLAGFFLSRRTVRFF